MSLRPRFAGDGWLRLPTRLVIREHPRSTDHAVAFIGRVGEEGYDPFRRVSSGLLLGEEFARADLSPSDAAAEWFEAHGALDMVHFLPPDPNDLQWPVSREGFHDTVADVLLQQETVRWHLLSLARLSDHLFGAGTSWDPRWAQPAVAVGPDLLWLGGRTPFERHIARDMRTSAEPLGGGIPDMSEETRQEWWRTGHAIYQRLLAESVPIVWVAAPEMRFPTWEAHTALDDPVDHRLSDGVGTDPWSLVELQRRFMAVFLKGAGEHSVEVTWPSQPERRIGTPLVVREQRTWNSLLAPVYVQLLEALRRISEGQRGAAFCKECGQPFLTLDARRSSFCTDRERLRYGQRAHRRRRAAADALPLSDSATAAVSHGPNRS